MQRGEISDAIQTAERQFFRQIFQCHLYHFRKRSLFSRADMDYHNDAQHDGHSIIEFFKNEDGYLLSHLLTIYLICLLFFLGVSIALGVSVMQMLDARYGWFSEAVEFATQAANTNGNLQEVIENENIAKQYFATAMSKMMPGGGYSIDGFQAIEPGMSVPHGIAKAPGYLARITVYIPVFRVPLIGEQHISVPMSYYALAKSQKTS